MLHRLLRSSPIALLALTTVASLLAAPAARADELDGLRCASRGSCALLAVASWEHGDHEAAARYFVLEADFGVAEDRDIIRRRLAEAPSVPTFVAERVAVHLGAGRATLAATDATQREDVEVRSLRGTP